MEDKQVIILYHGSPSDFVKPNLSYGRRHTDFGIGFYLTKNRDQAYRWGKLRAIKQMSDEFYVKKYRYEHSSEFRVKVFPEPNEEWLDMVAACRDNGGNLPYDIVIGPVADDKVFDVIDRYLDKKSYYPQSKLPKLKQQAIEELLVKESENQYVLITERALGKLQFVSQKQYLVTGGRNDKWEIVK